MTIHLHPTVMVNWDDVTELEAKAGMEAVIRDNKVTLEHTDDELMKLFIEPVINNGFEELGHRQYKRLRNEGWSIDLLKGTHFMNWNKDEFKAAEERYKRECFASAELPKEIEE